MFKQLQQLARSVGNILLPRQNNSMSLPNEFLKYGNRTMRSEWSDVSMSDQDLYTGYGYAAIRNRATAVARLALENIHTESTDKKDHPYLAAIDASPTFSNYAFWHDMSVFLDLEGVYYLLAVRAVAPGIVGDVMQFKMLNPYNVKAVRAKDDTTKIGGYIETRNGMTRELPLEMVIPIRELNPFHDIEPFAMTDAAKESQFTLKTSGDYTRNKLKEDINAPGIITTDVILPKEQFENFVARVKNHTKGEPLFGNGAGAIKYEDMASDLSKASLDKINEISRDALFSVAGVSKTIMGIEQSGTTRETSKTQKDLHIEFQSLPRVQLIIDALNQDYKNRYPEAYEKTKPNIMVRNPNTTDFDADLKETDVKTKRFDLYTALINKGYTAILAAKFVKGEIDLEQLGEPTKPPVVEPAAALPPPAPKKEEALPKDEVVVNEAGNGLVQQQEGHLKNAIVNVEEGLVAAAINRVTKKTNKIKNATEEFSEESDVITKTERNNAEMELIAVITAFYGIVMNLKGGEAMRDRVGTLAMSGEFTLDAQINKYIKTMSKKAASSHVDTIVHDLYKTVREDALKGLSQQEIIANIKKTYNETFIQGRAKVIAKTETNRAFTRAQYEADRQFIDQNKLEQRAFKRWKTRSSNPCSFCSALEAEGLVPFHTNFRSLGEDVTSGDKKLDISYEALAAGNAHPNCSCIYELVIETENRIDTDKKLNEAKKLKKETDEVVEQLLKLI